MKLVYGVGVNDADYVIQINETVGNVNGKQKQRLVWSCPFYRKWANMLERCYSYKYQEKQTTYTGCSVCVEWYLFSNFKSWMQTQDWEGKQLDKDILVKENKVYSSETCVFVSRTVNNFVIDNKASRGDWPVGVSWHKRDGKFVSRCCNPLTSKKENLGRFDNPNEAHQAWLTRKLELAKLLAAEQDDPRVAKALIERYENYTERF